jgi:hypothetical protein
MLPQSASMVHNDTNLSVYPMDVNCKDVVFVMIVRLWWRLKCFQWFHLLVGLIVMMFRNTGLFRMACPGTQAF